MSTQRFTAMPYEISVIYLAAGKGKRFGKTNKLFLTLHGKPLFLSALKTFYAMLFPLHASHAIPQIHEIFMNCRKEEKKKMRQILKHEKFGKVRLLLGGKTRQQSVFLSLETMKNSKHKPEFVIIHNAANPCVTREEISQCLKFLEKNPLIEGVAVGRPVSNTVKKVHEQILRSKIHMNEVNSKSAKRGKIVEKTLPRNALWEMETPQVVRFESFFEAHQQAERKKFETTDDIGLLEWAGFQTAVLHASEHNFKVTTPRDFPQFLFGFGEDVHAFSSSRSGLFLGGLLFKKYPKLEADSDGDVILHAITTAFLQALNKGSLGKLATPLFKKGVRDSKKYVAKMLTEIHRKNFNIEKINVVIEGKTPRIDPLVPSLKKSLQKILSISEHQISIAAHTGENLTSYKQRKGLRAAVQVMLTADCTKEIMDP